MSGDRRAGSFQPIPVGTTFLQSAPSWEAFEQSVASLRAKYGRKLLFRGQADSSWELSTTLERNTAGDMTFEKYYRIICSVGPEVKAFAGIDAPTWTQEDENLFSESDLLWDRRFPINHYKYMAYLRHHGFPSPLLDWSRSPFVAAFFAFREPMEAMNRAIFVYCESPEGIRSQVLGERTIHHLGPYVQTHHRHFRQQCDYTICATFDNVFKRWVYDAHQKAFENARRNENYLWKFEVPTTERSKVLSLLNDYNLNAFSLFGSEEGLLESMWFREYTLKRLESANDDRLVADSPLKKNKR